MRAPFFYLIIFIFISLDAQAGYYDVLPKGVRNFTYRFIQTGKVGGSYNSSGKFEGYNVNAKINADSLRGIISAVDTYLDTLSAADYAAFSFGTFEGSALSKVSAHAFGLGYGLTNRLTVYAFIPYYQAVVDLNLKRTENGRNNVGTTIQIEDLPDVDARLIQSLFVNYYGYRPLGKWEANDFGDTEFGGMYQLTKGRRGGMLTTFGFVAPTGRQDDSNTLQDIGFGDGQWDAFFELGGGYRFNAWWSTDAWARYTYQFPFQKTERLPDSLTFPVTSRSGNVKINPGNKYQLNFQNTLHWSDQWTTSLLYTYDNKNLDDYQSEFAISDQYLESNTNETTHTARINLGFSTVSLYKRKKFIAPMDLNIAGQSIFAGVNVPKYERYDFELRLYF